MLISCNKYHLTKQKYLSCIETLPLRNDRLEAFYNDPSVVRQDFDFETGRSLLTADAKKLFVIRRLTDALYHHVDGALPKLIGEIEAVEKFIKRRFRGRTALKMIRLRSEAATVVETKITFAFRSRGVAFRILLLVATCSIN